MAGSRVFDAYNENGFHLERGLFDTSTSAELEREFDKVVAQLVDGGEDLDAQWESAIEHGGSVHDEVLHTHNVQNYSARWLEVFRDQRLLDVAEQLIGPDIVLHHSKLFLKPARHGGSFPMHQDWRYFPTRDDSMIAAVIHLTPATIDMGCFRVVPGSHRLGKKPSTSGRAVWDDPGDYKRFQDEHAGDRARAIEAAAGDVLFFSYTSVHGSGPNRSDRPRKTVLAQLFSGTDVLDPRSEHAVSGLVLRGRNHLMNRAQANRANGRFRES